MESLKKHLEIYKINRQIRDLNRETLTDTSLVNYIGYAPYRAQTSFRRPSEKSEIIRQQINKLLDRREAIRQS